jgi:predicted AAA+ superfamily ATPase
MEPVFEEWNVYAKKKELLPRIIDLNRLVSDSNLKIVGVTGIRRSGKSSVLMLLLQKLQKDGKKAAYVNLEDSRISDKEDILDGLVKWFGDSGFLLLDEVTSAPDWEGWLARNHELLKGRLHLIVSSSRATLSKPSKPLRGRVLAGELYPLSFKEFLQFSEVEIEYTTAGIGRLERALNDYLVYGGFPEAVLSKDKTDKIRLLDSYFRDIVGLDVAEISDENISTVELFGKYVIETSYFSASKCLNFFKSLGHKIGKQSILNLEKHSQEGYLFFFVPIFSHSIKDRTQYPRKAYLGDTGFMRAVRGKTDMGRLFENAVYLELKRRKKVNQGIYYYRNKNGSESDFVITEGLKVKRIIQVTSDLVDEKTKERETHGLVECAKETGLKEGLIITKDKEGREEIEGIKIEYVTLWKWLLEEKEN